MSRGPILQCGFTKFSLGPNIRSISKKDAFIFFFFCISPLPFILSLGSLCTEVENGKRMRLTRCNLHLIPSTLIDFVLIFCHLDKYILQVRQIHFTVWTENGRTGQRVSPLALQVASCISSPPNHTDHLKHWVRAHIVPFGQTHFAARTDTFWNLGKYTIQFGQIPIASPPLHTDHLKHWLRAHFSVSLSPPNSASVYTTLG